MTENFGPGVSRVLPADGYQFDDVIYQQGRPPMDADVTLAGSIRSDQIRVSNLRGVPSGFLGSETNPQKDFVTDVAWSNYFKFGPQRAGEQSPIMWANVNGWPIPVTGTRTGFLTAINDIDMSNVIALDPPPGSSGDFRIDFVFLEAWKALISPNPSTTNKPSSSGIYKYGNVEGSFSYLADNLVDPSLGSETSLRTQIQYRIRVVKGLVALGSNPDGFDPAVVKAQGALTATTSYTFSNMRTVLGDPGLWRAGDGAQGTLGTVDGYCYAIPIAIVFRRNAGTWLGYPSQNLNGALNRNPTAVDRTGVKTFSTVPTLSTTVTSTALTLNLVSATASTLPLPVAPATPITIKVGDEYMTYSSITGTTINLTARGQNGSVAESHVAGTVVSIVSGRPDGLYSDQISASDILDLRHLVNPNGFDYGALLKGNLNRLLTGDLHGNWKFTGSGTRGSWVNYQDAIQSAATPLGVTQLDAPDNQRMVFSDAAMLQQVECIATPRASSYSGAGASITSTVTWSLQFTANTTLQSGNGAFTAGDVWVLPINQFKAGLQAGSTDQVRWVNDGISGAIRLRLEGETHDIDPSMYTVTPDEPYYDDDLTITFNSNFPTQTTDPTAPTYIHVTAHVLYGAGRGLSRRPDAINSISYGNTSTDLLISPIGVPASNRGAQVAPAFTWSRYASTQMRGALPSTSEMYADLGSGTVIVSPFRRITYPGMLTIDGDGANYMLSTLKNSTNGFTSDPNSTSLFDTSLSTSGVYEGDRLVINTGLAAGTYTVVSVPSSTEYQLDRPIKLKPSTSISYTVFGAKYYATGSVDSTNSTDINDSMAGVSGTTAGDYLEILSDVGRGRYTVISVAPTVITVDRPIRCKSGESFTYKVYAGQGVMPLNKIDGTAKWATTDPLNLFCGTTFSVPAQANIYVSVPRKSVPSWGEVRVPILGADTSVFSRGVNFGSYSPSGTSHTDADRNFVSYAGAKTYAAFSTYNPSLPGPLVYNSAALITGSYYAGMRQFTDTRGLGRQGLELPPFYGVARLFGVYEATDYFLNGSAFDPNSRAAVAGSGATNLLRQNLEPGTPTFWIEIDDDGDSTFILNADALDLTKSPTTISTFSAGNYVVEASVFGFDRGTFDLSKEARFVMTRPSLTYPNGTWQNVGGTTVDSVVRSNNINKVVAGVVGVLPGPATSNDQILVNYSRTPYQGDPWGSQSGYQDLPYAPGPVSTSSAYNISQLPLNGNALTRPNQKVLEVLAATSFSTTLGTGRLSGDATFEPLHFLDVGFENPVMYPPDTNVSLRPNLEPGNFVPEDVTSVNGDYLGASERLPLGGLFRDKDFRGQAFSPVMPSALIMSDMVGNGVSASLAVGSNLDQQSYLVGTTSSGVVSPGDILVLVDGELGDFSQVTNFRATRGGSVFFASGARPGGPVTLQNISSNTPGSHTNVLQGRALLVRNSVTNVGATEVSAGDELMLLVLTYVQRIAPNEPTPGFLEIGTDGTGEGYAAADLYRLDGHPLVKNNIRLVVDPSTIELSKGV